jgi:hypothetical protein
MVMVVLKCRVERELRLERQPFILNSRLFFLEINLMHRVSSLIFVKRDDKHVRDGEDAG